MYRLGDFLTQLQNAYMARKKELEYPSSRYVVAVAAVLEKEGLVGKVSAKGGSASGGKSGLPAGRQGKKSLVIELSYKDHSPAIKKIKLVSKPSVHHYISKSGSHKLRGSFGTFLLSTSKGIMTRDSASKLGLGGELICQIY